MAINESDIQPSFSIVDPGMTVAAMRDSGYKSTTHALAELIDNSIESGATVIELFGVSRRDTRSGRFTLKELAVLDNGEGMDAVTLRGSLRYGHGTRRQRRGIGRFGLGLPNSSMSQARRVDVWSWQSGVTNALYTWLSIDDVEAGASEIAAPELRPIPQVYRNAAINGFDDSGTLVVWTDLDGRIPDFPVTRSHPPASWPSAANSSICRTYRKTAGEESRRRSPVANRWMRP